MAPEPIRWSPSTTFRSSSGPVKSWASSGNPGAENRRSRNASSACCEASRGQIGFAGQSLVAARGLAKARTAPQAADGVPEPRHHAQPEPYGATHSHACRAPPLRRGGSPADVDPPRRLACRRGAVCGRITSICGHPSSRAASSSASRSPAPSPARRRWCFAMSRPRRSTSRSRRRSSTSSSICRRASASPISSFHMTSAWCVTSPTASRSCILGRSSRSVRRRMSSARRTTPIPRRFFRRCRRSTTISGARIKLSGSMPNPGEPAFGMPVPPALSALSRRHLPGTRAALAAGRRRASLPLPHSARRSRAGAGRRDVAQGG